MQIGRVRARPRPRQRSQFVIGMLEEPPVIRPGSELVQRQVMRLGGLSRPDGLPFAGPGQNPSVVRVALRCPPQPQPLVVFAQVAGSGSAVIPVGLAAKRVNHVLPTSPLTAGLNV